MALTFGASVERTPDGHDEGLKRSRHQACS
jgi:hypothetical protein